MEIKTQDLNPMTVVMDIVLKWNEEIFHHLHTAKVVGDSLFIFTTNHRSEPLQFVIDVHFSGSPCLKPPRWVLLKLGPTVWKLAPSILTEKLHAYITIINVPDPAPWE